MAFNRRLDSTFPGFGVGVRNDSSYLQTSLAMTTSGSPQTWPLPASGTFSTPFTAGKLRLKIYNGGGTTPAVTNIVVTFTDGTNTVYPMQGLYHPTSAVTISSTAWIEWYFDFMFDVASSGGSGTVGGMLATVGGANAGSVITTMTGSSGTASLDIDFFPLI